MRVAGAASDAAHHAQSDPGGPAHVAGRHVTADRSGMTRPGSGREQHPGTPEPSWPGHQFRPWNHRTAFPAPRGGTGDFPAVITGRSRCLFRWVGKIPVTIRNRSPGNGPSVAAFALSHPDIRTRSAILVIDHSRWSGNVPANGGCRPGEAAGRANRARIERVTQRSRGSVGGPGTKLHSPVARRTEQNVFDHGSSHRKAGAVTNPFPGRGGRCCRAS